MQSPRNESIKIPYRPFSVFISCPSDLEEHRDTVRSALGALGYNVRCMADLGVGEFHPVAVCLEAVAQCDVYLGIIGTRYGSIPEDPKRNPMRLSFTELEFRESQKLGKECIWILVGDDTKIRESDSSAEELRNLEALRQEIRNEHVFGSLRETGEARELVRAMLDQYRHRRRLEVELRRRYGSSPDRAFTVVRNAGGGVDESTVFLAAAGNFVAKILDGLNRQDVRRMEPFRVGVGGGRAHYRIVQQLDAHRSIIGESDRYVNLEFVALNTAAIASRFNFTANYLVARLADLFAGSTHRACLGRASRTGRARPQEAMHLILGGAGGKDAYLRDWLADRRGREKLPDCMIGDFCYVPIDAKGRAVRPSCSPALRDAAAHTNSVLRFRSLEDIEETVMLPLFSQHQITSASELTRKREIGHAVLSRLKKYHCVVDQRTARSLLGRQFCGYVLGASQGADMEGGVRHKAQHASTGKPAVVRIVHQTHLRKRPEIADFGRKEVDKEILISDPPGDKTPGAADVLAQWLNYQFLLDDSVQRPGMWAATLARVAGGLVRNRDQVRVLDMGCGCGAVGCIIGSTVKGASVVFADKDPQAVRNAHENAMNCKLADHSAENCIETDLFSAFHANKEKDQFDLVAFCPPFLPASAGIEARRPAAEVADWFGNCIANNFASQVSKFLRTDGYAVLCLPSYIESDVVIGNLKAGGLCVEKLDRHIAYPRTPTFGWPPAKEIRSRDRFEQHLEEYHFHDEVLSTEKDPEGREYVAFHMIHIIAHKPRPRTAETRRSSGVRKKPSRSAE